MDKHALDPACLLGDRLQTLSRAELTALAEALCRILAERGTYHGGIRPDNISRAADGTVGLGAPARTDTKDWTTEELEFMAPEVFWSGTLDASADVYSLGLLLYAGVSGGRLPFYPDDRAPLPEDQTDALRRRMNGEALPPARKAGRGLQEIIARATQCKPDDRYATPAELCAALEQYDAEQRRSVPTAQEMFNKPEQELSEVERMMLDILAEEAAAPVPEAEPEIAAEPEAEAESELKFELKTEVDNMLASCDGGESDRKAFNKAGRPERQTMQKHQEHCDAKKEDQDIPVSPLDIGIENFITYFDDGSVKGCDDSGEQLVQILGFNARYLQTLRKNAIDSYLEIPMDDIKTEIEKLHVLNSGRLQPFCFAIEQCLYAILKDKEDELALVAS